MLRDFGVQHFFPLTACGKDIDNVERRSKGDT